MTHEEADKLQRWAGMDGAIAYHLIDRHAEDWHEIGTMMEAWLRANVMVEREACAKVCEDFDFNKRSEIDTPKTLPKYCAAAIRARSNALGQAAAKPVACTDGLAVTRQKSVMATRQRKESSE